MKRKKKIDSLRTPKSAMFAARKFRIPLSLFKSEWVHGCQSNKKGGICEEVSDLVGLFARWYAARWCVARSLVCRYAGAMEM
jgi:hypothetical protein